MCILLCRTLLATVVTGFAFHAAFLWYHWIEITSPLLSSYQSGGVAFGDRITPMYRLGMHLSYWLLFAAAAFVGPATIFRAATPDERRIRGFSVSTLTFGTLSLFGGPLLPAAFLALPFSALAAGVVAIPRARLRSVALCQILASAAVPYFLWLEFTLTFD